MIISSEERSTGSGATRYTAVLVEDNWVRVSNMPGAQYRGRVTGYEQWSVEVPDGTAWARFYRSNSGKEEVEMHHGATCVIVRSFDDARRWAAEVA